jgi:hypothetical protein
MEPNREGVERRSKQEEPYVGCDQGKGGCGAIEKLLLSVTFWPPITTVPIPAAVF